MSFSTGFFKSLTTGIAALSAGIAAATMAGFLGGGDPTVRLKESELTELRSSVKAAEAGLEQVNKEMASIKDIISTADSESISISEMRAAIGDAVKRTESLETTLEIDAQEVIGLVRLRDSVDVLSDDLKDQAARFESELARLYSIIFATVGALLVAVVAMVVGNFLVAKGSKE